jgi:Cu(I)/Ag(I) efflux system membrane fusion protein
MKTLRNFVLVAAIVAVAVAGCGNGKQSAPGGASSSKPTFRGIGPYRVLVGNKPSPPVVGDNALVVTIQDSTGAPVRGAQVHVAVTMPAMGAMPAMESRGEGKESAPGVYRASYGLQMQGDWNVLLQVQGPGGIEVEGSYHINTHSTSIPFTGGTPAAGRGSTSPGGGASEPGTVLIDAVRRQSIGIKTAPVEMRDLTASIRAAGRVAYDETRRSDISLKFSGWVRDIRVDYTGRRVRAGETLFTVYSPDLLAAQQEYLDALRSGSGGADLAAAARQRLLLWDITPSVLEEIVKSGAPKDALPIVAPASGVVIEKNVVAGSSFQAGQTLYRIGAIDPVWVVANVYQYELPLVREGMEVQIVTPYPGEAPRYGRVSYVNPYLDPDTRTGEVRVEVRNPGGDLKPGMYVDALLERPIGKRLAVPESAVIYAGDRRVVFVDVGGDRLSPREVTLGRKAGDYYEVIRGLQAGDVVVTSGNFLVASESKLRSADQKW